MNTSPSTRPPRTPQQERRLKLIVSMLEMFAAELLQAPNDQAIVASAEQWISDNWDLIATGILGPLPTPPGPTPPFPPAPVPHSNG